MASGKKNYFRHSIFARNDDFVCGLIDKFGHSGYFYWFVLLELCAEQSTEDDQKFCRFHETRLYKELKCNRRRLEPCLNYMRTMSKLDFNHTGNYYEITIFNLPKYLGKYQNKLTSNAPNKRKEKERKEKESKVNKEKENVPVDEIKNEVDPARLINLWNKTFPEKMYNSFNLGSGKHLEKFFISNGYMKNLQDWEELFNTCKKSEKLMNKTDLDASWFGLLWILDYDNILKIKNGNFDSKKSGIDWSFMEKYAEA